MFNLAADPFEKTNLAKSNPEKAKALRARYDSYASRAIPPKNQAPASSQTGQNKQPAQP
jgi:hypothetical protein